jgi:serine/threonine protein kinase
MLISPECIKGGNLITSPAVDIWRFGLIFYTIFVGELPFKESNTVAIMRRILGGDLSIPAHLPKDLRAIMAETLKVDPSSRPLARWLLDKLHQVPTIALSSPFARSCQRFIPAALTLQPPRIELAKTRPVELLEYAQRPRVVAASTVKLRIHRQTSVK